MVVAMPFPASSSMESPGVPPPQDEDWQLEWRWGAAHPWLRPKGAAPVSAFSGVSRLPAPSSPRPSSSSSSLPSSSSSSVSSAPPCCSVTAPSPAGPSLDSGPLPSEPSLFPTVVQYITSTSCACSSSSGDIKISPVQDASTREKGCSVSTGAAASSSTAVSASFRPVPLPFCSFRRPQIKGTDAPAHRELTAGASPQAAATADTPPPTRLAGAGGATAPVATSPASSVSAPAVRGVEQLRDTGTKTAPACPVLPPTDTGAEDVREALQDGLRRTSAPVVSVAGPLPASREAAPTATKEPHRLPQRKAAADQNAIRKSEVLESAIPTAGEAVTPANLSVTTASPAPAATSAVGTRVEENRGQQKYTESAREPERVPQLLLQFGDQTLNFLQRQQMALWSFFAFRDWRVKTLVHALSAMGEPVNLVVVNCTPPPPAALSSSSAASSINASDCSLASSSSSLSPSHPSSASSMLCSKLPWLLLSDAVSQGESRTSSPAATYSLSAEQNDFVATDARAAAAPPDAQSSAALILSESPPISEPSFPTAIDAGRPRGRSEAALTAAAETEVPVAEAQLALLSSVSPSVGEDVVRGGYSPLYHTIWLCGNRLWSPFELRRVLLHELVHAFDFARANISPNNCRHVACTEIRAYNLSGQCGWWRTRSYDIEQFNTVQPKLLPKKLDTSSLGQGHHRQEGAPEYGSGQWQQTKRNRCLTHGALNSLRQHRYCQGPGVAEDAVRDVFTRCIRDTWPFLAPPERDSKWRPSRMWRPEAAEFLKR